MITVRFRWFLVAPKWRSPPTSASDSIDVDPAPEHVDPFCSQRGRRSAPPETAVRQHVDQSPVSGPDGVGQPIDFDRVEEELALCRGLRGNGMPSAGLAGMYRARTAALRICESTR